MGGRLHLTTSSSSFVVVVVVVVVVVDVFFSAPGSRMPLAAACRVRSHRCDFRRRRRPHHRASTQAVEACMHFGAVLLGSEEQPSFPLLSLIVFAVAVLTVDFASV